MTTGHALTNAWTNVVEKCARRWSKHLKRAGVEGYLHDASGSERQAPGWTAWDCSARDSKGTPTTRDSKGTPRCVHSSQSSPAATPRAVALPLYASSTGGHSAQEGKGASGGSRGGGQAVEEEEEELAPGWKQYISRSSQRPFYKNKATGATQWARPTRPAF